MADDEKKPSESPWAILWWVLGGLAILIVLWFANGGPSRANPRSLFVAPVVPIPQNSYQNQ